MRVFLCTYNDFSLAVPIDFVSSITLYKNGNPDKAIVYNEENNNTYISLPIVLKKREVLVRHGIVLKNRNDDDDTSVIENKKILLTTEIECEINIPEDEIYPLPKTLKKIKYSVFFSGLTFNSYYQNVRSDSALSKESITLLLNPEQLVKRIKRKAA